MSLEAPAAYWDMPKSMAIVPGGIVVAGTTKAKLGNGLSGAKEQSICCSQMIFNDRARTHRLLNPAASAFVRSIGNAALAQIAFGRRPMFIRSQGFAGSDVAADVAEADRMHPTKS